MSKGRGTNLGPGTLVPGMIATGRDRTLAAKIPVLRAWAGSIHFSS